MKTFVHESTRTTRLDSHALDCYQILVFLVVDAKRRDDCFWGPNTHKLVTHSYGKKSIYQRQINHYLFSDVTSERLLQTYEVMRNFEILLFFGPFACRPSKLIVGV